MAMKWEVDIRDWERGYEYKWNLSPAVLWEAANTLNRGWGEIRVCAMLL